MSDMRRLELEYDITNMSTLYKETTAPWQDAEFTPGKDFTAHLKLWEDGVEPEQISETWEKLKERAESFRVALRYLGNPNITFKRKGLPTYHFDDQVIPIKTKQEIDHIIARLRGGGKSRYYSTIALTESNAYGEVSLSPAPMPKSMPFIPQDLHRFAETLTVAEDLSMTVLPDLVMKLSYIIVEEFENNFSKDELEQFGFVRDFVSHPICYKKKKLVTDIGRELPSSKTVNDKGKDAVRFNRNDKDHMAFVRKYASSAFQRAKDLINEKIKREGGFLGE